jgi:hypothetical protein
MSSDITIDENNLTLKGKSVIIDADSILVGGVTRNSQSRLQIDAGDLFRILTKGITLENIDGSTKGYIILAGSGNSPGDLLVINGAGNESSPSYKKVQIRGDVEITGNLTIQGIVEARIQLSKEIQALRKEVADLKKMVSNPPPR